MAARPPARLARPPARDDLISYDDGVVDGSAEFVLQHLDGAYASSEIPSRHVRLPRPALEQVLAGASVEAIAAAYDHGYTMPAIARCSVFTRRQSAGA